MKFIFLITFIVLNSSFVFAKSALPALESKMWNFIVSTQVKDNKVIRTKGGWPSFSRFRGTNIHSQESNSFITSQLLVAINSVEKYFILPHLEEASIQANAFLDSFLEDTQKTNESPGTIAYWPLLKTPSGQWIRSFSTKFPYRNLKVFNVPNDLDASANYFMWLYHSKTHPEYLEAFAKSTGLYLDKNRKMQHKNDLRWKPTNSGAFLTWVEADKVDDPKSRIFNGVNDVDCIVNLNILTALLTYQNHLGGLSPETDNGVKASCKLINETVFKKKTDICAVWYDRSSQFFTAYSKAYLAQENIPCLNDSAEAAREDIIIQAESALTNFKQGKYTKIAEYIASIKKLWSPNIRTSEVKNLLKKLEDKLRGGIAVQGNHAFVQSTDSLFVSKLGLVTVDWYSPQFSTAIALEALLLP